ncbi:MAG TPA: DUF1329 domain-containing protein [Methylibium sp.]|nr:DUF1329 domain-containing protein [Methylibium sp.]
MAKPWLGWVATALLLQSVAVMAAEAVATPARTPVGAETAGNAAGTIPAWTGGLRSPPPGWQPSQGYIDPFADEQPLYTVDAAGASSYREQLSPGLQGVLARNPAFRMPVYPTHRTAAYAEAARRRPAPAGAAAQRAVPFPEARNGIEAITNHLLRDLGGGVERSFDSFVVRASGDVYRIGFHDRRVYDENFDESMPGRLFSYLGYFLSPDDLVGTIYLVHEPDPLGADERRAWVYNAGQRRVRRAPDLAYDNQQNGSDGLAIVDQYDGYNGRPDRYDWALLGKRELLVPYNNYRIGDKRIPYGRIIRKGSPNPELLRFELHRVWVVEAKLKTGQEHVYARRLFYLDEDSWSVLLSEAYDSRGQLWRVGLHSLLQYYDAMVPWYRFELWFDLTNDSYLLTGLDNEYSSPWRFGVRGRTIDFQPDALRRAGR